jgi:hypothetical protein
MRTERVCTQARRGLIPLSVSYIWFMTPWQPPKREPKKTKAELYEMLAEAVRNTQAENKRAQRVKKGHGEKAA